MERIRTAGALRAAALVAAAWLILPGFAQAQSYPSPDWSAPSQGSFITLAESDLAGLASQIPNVYPVPQVDTSGWAQYDVTTVGGTNPPGAANFSSCADLDNSGAQDNAVALRCMIQNMGDEALLYFPNGTYDIAQSLDGNAFFRPQPAYDRRGLIGQSRAAVINVRADFRNPVLFLEGEDPQYNAGSTSWNGGAGASRGETVIRVGSTSGFSTTRYAPGNWVELRANPNSVQDDAERRYYSRVTAIGSGTITMEHPLPEDFTGGSATARPWVPAEEWVMRNLTLQYEDGNHLYLYLSHLVSVKGMAHFEISNVTMANAYRSYLTTESSADLHISGSDFINMTWDKATNGYGMVMATTSRGWIHDNHLEHVTGIAFSTNAQELLVTFNDIRAPRANPAYDVSCRENSGDGGNNDCIVQTSSHLSHGPTEGSGYTHCSGNETDLLGYRGDASCRGTAASAVYSCAEWHDRSSSNTVFMRNYCEGPVWFDNSFGPGRHNFLFGNWLTDQPSGSGESFNTTPGNPGDFAFRSGFDGAPAGYEQNTIWANNLLEGNFGAQTGYNPYGNGVQVHDMVIGGSCIDHDASGQNPDGGVCRTENELRGGRNGVWQNNTVGRDTHAAGYNRSMPSLPGFDAWPSFSVTPSTQAPYVGPEMGDPDTTSRCLPAYQRFSGGC